MTEHGAAPSGNRSPVASDRKSAGFRATTNIVRPCGRNPSLAQDLGDRRLSTKSGPELATGPVLIRTVAVTQTVWQICPGSLPSFDGSTPADYGTWSSNALVGRMVLNGAHRWSPNSTLRRLILGERREFAEQTQAFYFRLSENPRGDEWRSHACCRYGFPDLE